MKVRAARLGVLTHYSVLSLAWLSLASGCTDVLSFLKLGDMFTSAMTGNSALLAIAIARADVLWVSRALTALFGFVLGATLATLMSVRLQGDTRDAVRSLLLLEIILLVACATLWSTNPDPVPGRALYGVILLSSMSMGIQGVNARLINVPGISTIVFTSTLISMVTSLAPSLAGRTEPASARVRFKSHIQAFAAYLGGAALAAMLISRFLPWLFWVPLVAVFFALTTWEFGRALQRSRP